MIIVAILKSLLIIERRKIAPAIHTHGRNLQVKLCGELWKKLCDIIRLCPCQGNLLSMTSQINTRINFFLKTICREQRGIACEKPRRIKLRCHLLRCPASRFRQPMVIGLEEQRSLIKPFLLDVVSKVNIWDLMSCQPREKRIGILVREIQLARVFLIAACQLARCRQIYKRYPLTAAKGSERGHRRNMIRLIHFLAESCQIAISELRHIVVVSNRRDMPANMLLIRLSPGHELHIIEQMVCGPLRHLFLCALYFFLDFCIAREKRWGFRVGLSKGILCRPIHRHHIHLFILIFILTLLIFRINRAQHRLQPRSLDMEFLHCHLHQKKARQYAQTDEQQHACAGKHQPAAPRTSFFHSLSSPLFPSKIS